MGNCLTEFNEEVYRRGLIEEGREEGQMFVIKKMYDKKIPLEKIAEILETSIEDVKKMLEIDL